MPFVRSLNHRQARRYRLFCMKKYSGMTLIELLFTIAIAGVLMALAIPSFHSLLVRRAVDTAVADLLIDFSYARSEALKRGHFVTICRSLSGSACDGSEGSWHTGWIVFDDLDGSRQVDTGEAILRVHGPAQGVQSINRADGSDAKISYRFSVSGSLPGSAGNLNVVADAAVAGGAHLLCIAITGRLASRPGAAAC